MINTKRIILIIVAFIMFSPLLSLAGTVDLPKTGQITNYYPGDDGDIQAGVPWPDPRFTDNGNGTVTDNLTGLIWLKDANCIATNYPDFDNDVTVGDGRVTWFHALDFVAGINNVTYPSCGAGHTDWRLPNINEREILVNAKEINLAAWLNSQGFINVQAENYWSSTTWPTDTNGAWFVNMESGSMFVINKFFDSTVSFVWPVRGVTNGPAQAWKTGQTTSYYPGDDGDIQTGVPWPDPRFTDNGNGTVTDNLTGLIWLKDAFCFGHHNWQDAFNTVVDFNANPGNYNCQEYTANYTWRLPNRKEYNSLTDFSQSQPSIALPIGHPFINVFGFHNWSSTTYAIDTNKAWFKFMENGHMNDISKNDVFPFFLVRWVTVPETFPRRVSVASDGSEANGDSNGAAAISADGRYTTFGSAASNLVPEDTNGVYDIFVHDHQTNETTRVSVAADGTQANGDSYYSSISADGRYVAFNSGASNLDMDVERDGDMNGGWDTFIHDRTTGQTTRISVSEDGIEGNSSSDFHGIPSISADGRYVAFVSDASNLVPGDTNGVRDTFVYDRTTKQLTRINIASDGSQANGASDYTPSISGDGQYVVFGSDAPNLVPGDTNETRDIFVHDRTTSQTTRVNVTSDGSEANGISFDPAISADGRYVAFISVASNLVPGGTSGRDAFVHDRSTGQTTRVSVASDGSVANGESNGTPSISANGRYVVFDSAASNLVPGDTNGHWDTFVHDRTIGQTIRVNVTTSGSESNGYSYFSSISDDGQYVAFWSLASNLVPGDTNGTGDVFVVKNSPPSTSHSPVITLLGDNPLSITQGNLFTDPGATATDVEDGDISSSIQVSGTVDTSIVGTTTLTYTVMDSQGLVATPVVRTVIVVAEIFPLRVTREGNGTGTVTSNPSGIDCGGICSTNYMVGTSVTLTAIAAEGSTFTGWSGGGCSGTGNCVVTVNAETMVTATFVLNTYSISGRVTDYHSNPISGVEIVSYVPGKVTTTTNSDGYYIFSGLPQATYYLRPYKTSYRFSPRHHFVDVASNIANINFQGARFYAVSGRVTDEHGDGIPGAMIIADTGQHTRTNSLGFFEHWDSLRVMEGSRTFTVSKAGYTFVPTSLRVPLSDDISGLQFRGYNKPPIVMVHGWNSNAEETFKPLYSYDVPWELEQAGYHVEFANLQTRWSWTPSVENNVPGVEDAIKRAKDATGQPKVIVIAHSMGGLVSRAYIEGSRYRDDVLALYTFGSPHLGTPVAVLSLVTPFPLGGPGVYDMSHVGAFIFNLSHQKRRAGVDYHVIGGDAPMDVVIGRLWSCVCIFVPIVRDTECPGWCWTVKSWENRVPTWAGGHAKERNFWGWTLGNLIPGQDDAFVSTDSATGHPMIVQLWFRGPSLWTSLDGLLDRGSTDEVHGTAFGEYTYFNRSYALSKSYTHCLKKVLVDKTTNTCGRWHNSERKPVTAAVAFGLEGSVSLAKASSAKLAESPPSLEEFTPLESGTLMAGQTVLNMVQVEGGAIAFTAHWTGGSVAVTLIDPNGQTIDPAFAAGHPDIVTYRSDETRALYYLPDALPGEWQIQLEGGSDIPTEGSDYSTFVVFEESPPALEQHTQLESGTLLAGQIVEDTLRIEGGTTAFSAHWTGGSVAATLIDPNGQTIDPAFAADHPDIVTYGADETTAIYYLSDAAPGEWQIQLEGGSDIPAEGSVYRTFAAFESPLTVTATMDNIWYAPHDIATINASFSEPPASATVTATLLYSDGTSDTVTLSPNGSGQYETYFSVSSVPGYTQVNLVATGTTGDGAPFERGEYLLFQISPASVALTGVYSDVPQPRPEDPSLYHELTVTVGIDSAINGNIGLSAKLVSEEGNVVAHSLTREEVTAGDGILTLRFTGKDLFAAQQNGPYRLTNLLLTDQREATLVVAEAEDVYTTGIYDYRAFAERHDFPTVSAEGRYSVDEGDSITLTAVGNDPENDALAYVWDLDDDGIFETPGQSVIFSAAGIGGPSVYIIRVQITDSVGFSAIDQTTLDVMNVAPVVHPGLDAAIQLGDTFSNYGFFVDPGADTWTATVDYGDDTGVQPLELTDMTFELSHLYGEIGIYPVTVTVSDDDDGEGTVTFQVTVSKEPGDLDGDGVADEVDACSYSDLSPTVVIDGCDTGVGNLVGVNGCTIVDQIARCAVGAENHGQFVSCVAQLADDLKKADIISGKEKGSIQRCAARANIP